MEISEGHTVAGQTVDVWRHEQCIIRRARPDVSIAEIVIQEKNDIGRVGWSRFARQAVEIILFARHAKSVVLLVRTEYTVADEQYQQQSQHEKCFECGAQ